MGGEGWTDPTNQDLRTTQTRLRFSAVSWAWRDDGRGVHGGSKLQAAGQGRHYGQEPWQVGFARVGAPAFWFNSCGHAGNLDGRQRAAAN